MWCNFWTVRALECKCESQKWWRIGLRPANILSGREYPFLHVSLFPTSPHRSFVKIARRAGIRTTIHDVGNALIVGPHKCHCLAGITRQRICLQVTTHIPGRDARCVDSQKIATSPHRRRNPSRFKVRNKSETSYRRRKMQAKCQEILDN